MGRFLRRVMMPEPPPVRSVQLPRSRSTTPEFSPNASPEPSVVVPGGFPENHFQRNMFWWERSFPEYYTNRRKLLLQRHVSRNSRRRRLLHASRLTCHYALNPGFYHPNRYIRPVEAPIVLRKLARFPSLHPRAVYRALLPELVHGYRRVFETLHASEQDVRVAFSEFIGGVIVKVNSEQFIKSSSELYAGAGYLSPIGHTVEWSASRPVDRAT